MTPEERRLRKNESRRRRYRATSGDRPRCTALNADGFLCRNAPMLGTDLCYPHTAPDLSCPCGACRVRRSAHTHWTAPADGQITVRWLLQMAREFDEVAEPFPAVDFVVWLLADVRGTREYNNVVDEKQRMGLETARDTMLLGKDDAA